MDAGNSKKYEVETIQDSAIYMEKLEGGQLSSLYYLIAWKNYLEEKNTEEPVLAVQHLKKLINLFHNDYPRKLTATSPLVNSALPMAKPITKLTKLVKWK